MICPECDSEYVDGYTMCPACDVALQDDPAPRNARDVSARAPELETAFSTYDASELAIAKSILLSAEIPFSVAGEQVQDLFGYGRFPAGGSVLMGPVRLLVAEVDAADAAALLSTFSADPGVNAAAGDPTVESHTHGHSMWSTARLAGKVIAGLMLLTMIVEAVIGLWVN